MSWEIAVGTRRLKSGREKYNRYFPLPKVGAVLIHQEGDTFKTVAHMQKMAHQFQYETKAIAQILKGKTLLETCKNIHTFLWDYVQYDVKEVEGENELLRTPARVWYDAKADCDCFSIFISSVLLNLGINHAFRKAKYIQENGSIGAFQHIYVIVPTSNGGYITIDPVIGKFNHEKQYHEKLDFNINMRTYMLNGFGATAEQTMSGKKMLAQILEQSEKDPRIAEMQGYTQTRFNDMLNHAIKNWDNPSAREKALDALAKSEQQQAMAGLGATKKSGGNTTKTVTPPANATPPGKPANSKPAPKTKAPAKPKFFSKLKDKITGGDGKVSLKDAVRVAAAVTPVVALGRNGALIAIRLNLFKLKDKLAGSEKGRKAIEEFWYKAGGSKEALHNAIYSGKNKSLRGLGTTGVGEAAAITAAIPFLIKIFEELKKAGVLDKVPSVNELKSAVSSIGGDGGGDSGTSTASEERITSGDAPEEQNNPKDDASYTQWLKDNPAIVAAGLGAIGLAAYYFFFYEKEEAPKPQMGALPKRKAKKRTQKEGYIFS